MTTEEQLNTVIDSNEEKIKRIYLAPSLAMKTYKDIGSVAGKEVFLSTPYILRNKHVPLLNMLISGDHFDGILIRNHESFGYINSNFPNTDMKIVLDSGMYILNHEAFMFYHGSSAFKFDEFYNSYELNSKETDQLMERICQQGFDNVISSYIVYGRIPMMISANCVKNTTSGCEGTTSFTYIKDRYDKSFPVLCDCDLCTNVIYNSVPLSLHRYTGKLLEKGNIRIDLTDETATQTERVLELFTHENDKKIFPGENEYTTGHYKRGIE
ncbi:MAG: hypothetical protein K5888_04870 [Lachnospiraceae bacterium]|nr:hypothetical protein [Lachnospiraceae bacterium]